jgi:iron only hydrogenase large subunit-like protein
MEVFSLEKRIHTVAFDKEKCIGCVDCVKACPTRAIRVRDGLATAMWELCIDCGECVRVCRYDAALSLTSSPSELRKFQYRIAMPSPVLYTQFGRQEHPDRILQALRMIGFDDVYDETWMCEMVSAAIDTYLTECRGPWPRISTTCPAVMRLIVIRYPDLVEHFAPIIAPRELAARELKRKKAAELGIPEEDIGIFHITPCSAKAEAINDPLEVASSHLDGAISIREIFGPISKALKEIGHVEVENSFSPVGMGWAMSGGEINGMRNENVLAVHGVQKVLEVLDRIDSRQFRNVDFLEMYLCPDGCISGPLTVTGRYEAQHTLALLIQHVTSHNHIKEEKVRNLYRERYFTFEREIQTRPIQPLAPTLSEGAAKAREKLTFLSQLPQKDCAACGAPDCKTLADDVIRGRARLSDCVFIRLAELEETTTSAPMTHSTPKVPTP